MKSPHAVLPVEGTYNLYQNEILIEENIPLPGLSELGDKTILAYFTDYLKSGYAFEAKRFSRGTRNKETGIEIINQDDEMIVIIHYGPNGVYPGR